MAKATSSVKRETLSLARHSVVYGIGNLLNRIVGFLLIPLYTRVLVPADYGALELLGLTSEFVGILLSVRLSRAVYRFYFEYEGIQDRNEVVSTAILSFGIIGFAGISLISPASATLAQWLLKDRSLYGLFLLSFATLWFNTVATIGLYYLQAVQRSIAYVTFSSIKLLVTVGLTVYLVLWTRLGLVGVLWGNLIGAAVGFLLVVGPILWHVGVRLSLPKLRQMLGFGLPLIPGAVSNFFVLVSDRFFVNQFVSLGATGLYALSYKFALLPDSFVTVPFFQSWTARRLELMREPGSEEKMGRIVTYFLVALSWVGLAVAMLVGDVLKIMSDSNYWQAARYVPLLVLAYILFGLFNHFSVPILIAKKTKYLSYVDVSNGLINLGLNILLIPLFGIWGACWATFVSYTLRIAMLYWLANRIQEIYFEFGRFAKILAAGLAVYGASQVFSFDSPWLGLIMRAGMLVSLFPMALVLLGFFRPGEFAQLRSFLSSGRSWIAGRLRPQGVR